MTISNAPPNDPFLMSGVTVGLVSEGGEDPENLGRVKLSLPMLGIDSNWARCTSFFAGSDKGAYFPPKAGDEVLVAFEMGDISRPYVIGVLWNGVDNPPVDEANRATEKVIKTAAGLLLKFDDNPDAMQIEITDGKGMQILVNSTEKKLSLISTGDIEIKTETGRVSISGTEVEVAATANLSLKADGEATLGADGETSVSGAMVKIN